MHTEVGCARLEELLFKDEARRRVLVYGQRLAQRADVAMPQEAPDTGGAATAEEENKAQGGAYNHGQGH